MGTRKVVVRQAYGYDSDQVSLETGLVCPEESLAVQSSKDECDINTIVRRFGLTGQMPTNVRPPTYGDFTGITDFRDALDAVMAAEEAFLKMPAHVRSRFENDPAQFVDFCSDDKNIEEMRRLGLAVSTAPAAAGGESGST